MIYKHTQTLLICTLISNQRILCIMLCIGGLTQRIKVMKMNECATYRGVAKEWWSIWDRPRGETILTSQTRGKSRIDESQVWRRGGEGRRLNHRTQPLSDQRPIIRWGGQGRISIPTPPFSHQILCQCLQLDKGNKWKVEVLSDETYEGDSSWGSNPKEKGRR